MENLMEVSNLVTGYDQLQILWGPSLDINAGERIVILGANGAGKTTLLRAMVGLLPTWDGFISFEGRSIEKMSTDARIRLGISYVSDLGIIPDLSVEDNLKIGGYRISKKMIAEKMDEMFGEFPILKDRRKKPGGSLSGGQRKMLAIARGLMSGPKLIIMDEPSAGLSPLFVNETIEIINRLEKTGIGFMIAEQNVKFLEIADRVFVLDSGKMIFSGTVRDLENNDAIHRAYFGVVA